MLQNGWATEGTMKMLLWASRVHYNKHRLTADWQHTCHDRRARCGVEWTSAHLVPGFHRVLRRSHCLDLQFSIWWEETSPQEQMIEENLHHRIYPAFSTNGKDFAQQHGQIPNNALLLPPLQLLFQLQVFAYSSDTCTMISSTQTEHENPSTIIKSSWEP